MMIDTFTPVLFAVGLFFSMLFLQEVGRRIGIRGRAKDSAGTGIGTMEGAVFALLGLLIAFTFSGAASRFDGRRQLVAQEANAIGTAYLRLDLLAPDARSALRPLFSQYLDSRLAVYQKLPDLVAAQQEWARGVALQGAIWAQATTACRAQGDPPSCMLLLPAMNEMIDITTTRAAAMRVHPPWPIFFMLLVTALVCALLGGHAMLRSRAPNWFHIIGFAAIVTLTLYVIADLEYPRLGQIQVGSMDSLLENAVK